MITPLPRRATIDRAATAEVLYRVAVSAFTYYPGKPWEHDEYTVAEDVEWCLAPLPAAMRDDLAPTVELLITTPTANRRPFLRHLAVLGGEDVGPDGDD